MAQTYEFPKTTVRRLDDMIIENCYKSGVRFELKDAIEANDAYVKLANGKPFVSLIDGTGIKGEITNEARQYFAQDKRTKYLRLAEALVVENAFHRTLAKLYILYNRPLNPIRIFSKREEAIKWLHTVYEKQVNENSLI